MIRRPPRSTLFPYTRSSDLSSLVRQTGFKQGARNNGRHFFACLRFQVKRAHLDRKSTRLNSSHTVISYAVFCLKKKKLSHADLRCSQTSSKRVLVCLSRRRR